MQRDDFNKNPKKDKKKYVEKQAKVEQPKKIKYVLKESLIPKQSELPNKTQKDRSQQTRKLQRTERRYQKNRYERRQTEGVREEPKYKRYEQQVKQSKQQLKKEYNKDQQKYQGRGKEAYFEKGQEKQAKPLYENKCIKYMKDGYQLEKDSHGFEDKIKKIKKLFKKQFSEAKDIKVFASKSFPMIYFEYLEDQKSIKPIYMHLRDAFKRVHALKENHQLFEAIFERIAQKVPQKFYKLAIFAIEKAKSIKLKLSKESIFNQSEGNDVMFYYLKAKENYSKINFILFDRGLRFFQFNSNFIMNFEGQHPEQFKCFNKFKKQVFQQCKQGYGVDIMMNEELSSEEEDKVSFEEKSIPQLANAIELIVRKDITELQNKIQKKEQQMNAEGKIETSSDRFKLIEEQYQDLTENRDNFINIRESVKQKLIKHKANKDSLKVCLKKLIIAEKQLQSRLPIVAKKRKIFQMLRRQNLLIIEGETGSGKSTQLPQMLCEYYDLFQNHSARPVLVTQPRRLATRTLAERVAKEMGEEVGGFVDYVASGGRRVNKEAKIIFKLDRLVLDEITEDNLLSNYSCLVIDQAHERTISIDVILGLVKELLTKRKDFKVIVTSASMDIQLFQSYFGTKTLKVSGRTFPVTITYKDYERYKEGDKYQMVYKIRKVIDEQVLFDSSSMKSEFKGHVLCFCSSVDQITELVKFYDGKLNKRVFDVFALHGKVTPADQKKVFEDTGKHKFIFSSRIAETAITIDGVRVVIDPGQDIELVFDQKYKVSSMKLQDITQSSAKQRAGRSGRTGPGHCFRLYSEQNFKKRKANKIPEIKNSSLETVVLRLKTLRVSNVISFPYIEKPDEEALKRSLQILRLIGALNPKSEITKIGELLIKLPIEPFLSRAIIQAIIFDKILRNPHFKITNLPKDQSHLIQSRGGVIKTVIEILSTLINFSNLFFIRTNERQKGEQVKYNQFSDQQGDFFFLDNIYRKYKELKQSHEGNNRLRRKNNQLYMWVQDNFLNFRVLRQIEELVEEITKIIEDYSMNEKEYEQQFDKVKSKLRHCTNYRQVILSCLITSFSANLCKFSGNQQVGFTIVNQRRPIQIYGTSNLSLLGIKSDWIICYDLYTNEQGRLYCKLAHRVQYKFMKQHIDKYIWRQFDIEAIERNNPFYTQFTCNLSTKLLQQIKFDFYKCDNDNQLSFLRGIFPSIIQQTNKISFFIMNTQKDKRKEEIKNDETRLNLNEYLSKLQMQSMKPFRHNYIGNIFISLTHGFQICNVQFSNKQFCIQIIAPNNYIVQQIEADSRIWGQPLVEDILNDNMKNRSQSRFSREIKKKRIKVFILQQQNKKSFIDYLVVLNNSIPNNQHKIQFKESLVDKRRKIPQTKILLHYFAGSCKEDKALISYSTYPDFQEGDDEDSSKTIAQKQLQLIKAGALKKSERGGLVTRIGLVARRRGIRQEPIEASILSHLNMHSTKNKTGINVYNCSYDQYQIAEELYSMEKANLLTHQFKFPSFIKKFRQPEISQARKTNEEWKQEISLLLEKLGIKKENVTINIHGFYKPSKDSKQKTSEMDRSLRVDMNATLFTLDNTIFKKLKDNYDGRRQILGCQKTHVRVIYEQIITICALKAFNALYEEFENYILDYKIKYPLMRIEQISIKTRNKSKIMIKAISSKRQDFLEPQRVISKLFTANIIKLQASEFRFLDKMDAGIRILDMIEEQYNFKIYFGFQRGNHSIKVYCEDADLKNIQNRIKEQIKKQKFYSEGISYRGKNLNNVKKVLQNLKKQLTKEQMFHYEINFQHRKVQLTAGLDTFERVRNEILKMTNSQKKQCSICADIMRNPYKFINCECTFCWLCITDHLRAFRNSVTEENLHCPSDECKKLINIFDVRTLLTEEEFQKMCDIKISKFIEKSKGEYIACKYCQNFFEEKEFKSAKMIECQICGKSECLKCREYHPNYSCEEWKERDSIERHIKGLGIKKCSKCGNGIEKNGGCNHMTCSICKTHLCWKCLKFFESKKLCEDHLIKEHGGIFDLQTL